MGYGGKILKTINSGANWEIKTSGTTNNLFSVFFSNENNATAVGTAVILRTSDGGENWASLPPVVTGDLYSVSFGDIDHGIAAGQLGRIINTTNSGIGINLISNEVPTRFVLKQNYPNPFNPVTKIQFSIPASIPALKTNATRLSVHNITGELAAVLFDEFISPGDYEYEWNAEEFPSGIYICTLSSGQFRESVKMVLIK